jgi:hypothetical protein
MSGFEQPLIFVMGSARSGTTWLAKLLDSHPDVLYRHEPDSVLWRRDIPFDPAVETVRDPQLLAAAGQYVHSLAAARDLKSAGRLPVFEKSFRSAARHRALVSALYGMKAADRVLRKVGVARTWRVPDLINPHPRRPPVRLIKSVTSLCRTRLFAEAAPHARFIHIVRHPCGVAASRLKGRDKGHLADPGAFFEAVHRTAMQRGGYGLSVEDLRDRSTEERVAWQWMVHNDKVVAEMAGRPNYRMVLYEDLCLNPMKGVRDILDFAGLPWDPQVGDTVRALNSGGDDSYFGISRDAVAAAWKWRRTLRPEQVSGVMTLIAPSPLAALFQARMTPEDAAKAPAPRLAAETDAAREAV